MSANTSSASSSLSTGILREATTGTDSRRPTPSRVAARVRRTDATPVVSARCLTLFCSSGPRRLHARGASGCYPMEQAFVVNRPRPQQRLCGWAAAPRSPAELRPPGTHSRRVGARLHLPVAPHLVVDELADVRRSATERRRSRIRRCPLARPPCPRSQRGHVRPSVHLGSGAEPTYRDSPRPNRLVGVEVDDGDAVGWHRGARELRHEASPLSNSPSARAPTAATAADTSWGTSVPGSRRWSLAIS